MSLAAVEGIDDAIDGTKHFLTPFEWGTWLRLAFVLFFVGSGGGLNWFTNVPVPGGEDDGGGSFQGGAEYALSDPLASLPSVASGAIADGGGAVLLQSGEFPTPDALADLAPWLLAVLVLLVLALFLALWFVGEVMEFVFVRSLMDEEVHVRRYFVSNVGNGLQLLVFRFGLAAATILVGVLGFFGFLLATTGSLDPSGNGPALALVVLGALLLVFLYVVADGFTTVFAVPIMLAEDTSIVSAWGALLKVIGGNLKEYAAYFLLSVALGIGVGILAAFVGVFVAIVVAIPFVAAAGAVVLAASGTAMVAGLVLVGVLGVLSLMIALQFVRVPLDSFLRYYAMFVLGDTAESIDPIPDLRAEVRAE